MNTKLQELTEKIYQEGVEKGQKEAASLIEKAKSDAASILEQANDEAAALIASATHKAEELTRNTQAELKLFANQMINALKTEITDLVCGDVVTETVKAATAEKDFMQKAILGFVQQMADSGSVVIETAQAEKLTAYFKQYAKELLNKGVTIKEVNTIKTQFVVTPSEGGYKLTFGDDEFIAFFKEFLRPKLVEMLFNK